MDEPAHEKQNTAILGEALAGCEVIRATAGYGRFAYFVPGIDHITNVHARAGGFFRLADARLKSLV